MALIFSVASDSSSYIAANRDSKTTDSHFTLPVSTRMRQARLDTWNRLASRTAGGFCAAQSVHAMR